MAKNKSSDGLWFTARTQFTDLRPDLVKPLRKTDYMIRSYLAGISFIVQYAAQDNEFKATHLLSYIAQDYIQSAVSISMLAMEGVHNVAKRELRFLIEASIKICIIQQKSYESLIEEKLKEFDTELSSPRISMKQNLLLLLLPESLRDDFCKEVGRVYGLTSNYVHLTPKQIEERIAAVDAGRTAARENAADVKALNDLLSRGLACSLVLLFHSVHHGSPATGWLMRTGQPRTGISRGRGLWPELIATLITKPNVTNVLPRFKPGVGVE